MYMYMYMYIYMYLLQNCSLSTETCQLSKHSHQKFQPLSTQLGEMFGSESCGQSPQDAGQAIHLLLGHGSTVYKLEGEKKRRNELNFFGEW